MSSSANRETYRQTFNDVSEAMRCWALQGSVRNFHDTKDVYDSKSTFEPGTFCTQMLSYNQCVIEVKYDSVPSVDDEYISRD
jgi:hypothetical protein